MNKNEIIKMQQMKLARKNNALWRCLRLTDLLADEAFSVIEPDDEIFSAWLKLMRKLILSELDK